MRSINLTKLSRLTGKILTRWTFRLAGKELCGSFLWVCFDLHMWCSYPCFILLKKNAIKSISLNINRSNRVLPTLFCFFLLLICHLCCFCAEALHSKTKFYMSCSEPERGSSLDQLISPNCIWVKTVNLKLHKFLLVIMILLEQNALKDWSSNKRLILFWSGVAWFNNKKNNYMRFYWIYWPINCDGWTFWSLISAMFFLFFTNQSFFALHSLQWFIINVQYFCKTYVTWNINNCDISQ